MIISNISIASGMQFFLTQDKPNYPVMPALNP